MFQPNEIKRKKKFQFDFIFICFPNNSGVELGSTLQNQVKSIFLFVKLVRFKAEELVDGFIKTRQLNVESVLLKYLSMRLILGFSVIELFSSKIYKYL
jgi:hypothetical protein